MRKEIHTANGYFTDGTYIKCKLGERKVWRVETEVRKQTKYFKTEEEADKYINTLTAKSDEKQH